MGLEALHELVKVLGERIDTHRAELSQSEALTRYARSIHYYAPWDGIRKIRRWLNLNLEPTMAQRITHFSTRIDS